jgi:hypothetical protein
VFPTFAPREPGVVINPDLVPEGLVEQTQRRRFGAVGEYEQVMATATDVVLRHLRFFHDRIV